MSGEETRRGYSDTPAITKIPLTLDGDEEEEEGEGFEEETIAEVMRWLEREISCPPPPSPANNGNQDLCGASFSNSASTVMANVDTRAAGGGMSCFSCGGAEGVGTWNNSSVGNRGFCPPDMENGCGGGGAGAVEEWMVKDLSDAEFEEWIF
ncbi:hypothetical protein HPP92_022623 [Vanilla planifolia]|uniref:Uncharacterized protein n=1 Tax=Vanilla planifolia TaxID=51239 RepID=A0A835PVR0_VANPL|nr:hypothetical protein HPP92_022623 [Vanilla planifolia]